MMSKKNEEEINVEAVSLEKAHQLLGEMRTQKSDLEIQNQELKRELDGLKAQNLEEPHPEKSLFKARDRRNPSERNVPPDTGLLRCIIDTIGDLIYVKDMDGVYRGCNKASERFVGLKEAEQIGKTDFDFFSRVQAKAIQDTDRLIATSKLEHCSEEWVLSSDGRKVLLETQKAPFYGRDGKVAGIVGISRDITERKELEENYRRLSKLTSDYVHCCTRTGKAPFQVKWVDGAVDFISGYRIEEVLTLGCFLPLVHPEDRQTVADYLLSLVPGDSKSIEFRILTQQKEVHWVSEKSHCEAGQAEGELILLGAVTDITERKKAETALKDSNEELDAFVQTVAHDLRTPITPIIGYAEILRENYKEQLDEQGLSYLTEIEKAGEEILTFMEDLLSLAQSGELKRPVKRVSTDEVVEGVIKNLEADISSAGVVLQTTSLPPVRVPKTFLIQIFDNLIRNAVRYAGNSGSLIEVGGEQTGKQIRFFVRDHGPGIPEQEREHIFEIFYRGTNKGEAKGSGVGLSIVYKIARNCGGRAWVEETHGGGCTFWVEIEDVAHS